MKHCRNSLIAVVSSALLLVGCGTSQDDAAMDDTPSLSNSSEEATELDAPELSQGESTTVSVSPEVMDSALSVEQESLDIWYLEEAQNSGISASQSKLFSTRDEVCSLIDGGSTIENVVRKMDGIHDGLSEEQKGTIIASSMVSQCQDASVSVDTELLPE